ncbi:MAG: cyclophilin type peptidyl-prolyl cis-trans isomerase [Sphingomonas bacterium]|nr:peptidylprolyl isomerase [Sphingomonas bacterium]MDB5688169.1 cyclophilin type peptidyl-prolyl cis-trans isomerase [Sphingomonas bacterium]
MFLTRLLALLALLLTVDAPAAPRAGGLVRVRLETSAGPIVVAVDVRRAPITAGNFLRYVDEKRLDGTTFYRAARSRNNPKSGLVQGGNNHKVSRSLAPIAHEPTSRTGLRHVDGTLSMARNAPGSAMGDFFITVGAAKYLDARPGYPGYAAFGHVVSGMDVVGRILALPTYPGGYSIETMGQSIRRPVRIVAARRVR